MSKEKFNSIFINGEPLRPSPYISTTYEYNRSGNHIIGGLLIITLSGTIVGEDLSEQISKLRNLQIETNCISVKVGCSGGSDFLDGAGRVRSVTINPSDQSYLASYSMQIALETVGGAPAVEPDDDFLQNTCIKREHAKFLKSYSETLTIEGEGTAIASVDNVLKVSKSYIKARGKIIISSFMREICGIPDYNGAENSINIIQERAKALMAMDICSPKNNPISQFSGWNKWLDTKSLTIDSGGSTTWSFDMYMSQGDAQPIAWIDINTEDQENQNRKIPLKRRQISGSIKGLSRASVSDYLANKADTNERIGNAEAAYSSIASIISSGSWPSDGTILFPRPAACQDQNDNPCPEEEEAFCDQRISSTVKKSVVSGEITFSAEYGPISACQTNGTSKVDFTTEEQLPVARYVEYIIPGAGDSLVISLNAPTPHKVTVSARGTLQACDKTKLSELMRCVDEAFNKQTVKFNSWLVLNESKTIGTYSYSKSKEFIKCEG